MSEPRVTSIGRLAAPWGKEIELQELAYDNGFAFLRLRIREGRRFTDLDLDATTALGLTAALDGWTRGRPGGKG